MLKHWAVLLSPIFFADGKGFTIRSVADTIHEEV
jgi:hypothetical protein